MGLQPELGSLEPSSPTLKVCVVTEEKRTRRAGARAGPPFMSPAIRILCPTRTTEPPRSSYE